MSILQIKSLVQFSRGGSIVWNSLVTPLPNGVVAFAIDDLTFKLGDGVTLYSALPTLFTFNDLTSAQGGISGLFELPVALDQGEIVSISIGTSGELEYRPSGTTLSSILTRIGDLETSNSNQTAAIAGVLAAALDINVNINTAPDNHVVVINNGLYSDSGMTIADLESQIEAAAVEAPGIHLVDVVFYSDVDKTWKADKTNMTIGTSYYAQLSGHSNEANTSITYGLTATNSGLVITKVSDDLFKIDTTGVVIVTQNTPIALIASASNNLGGTTSKAIAISVREAGILASIYGGTNNDVFYGVAIDSNNNIICAGFTHSEGTGSPTYQNALVVKFDSNLNILARKVYSGATEDGFYAVAIDSNDNIICVGWTGSEGAGTPTYWNALVVKFDSTLTILARKTYSGANGDIFYGVAIDSNNNIICAGFTHSEGVGAPAHWNALVVKFDSNLTILARKIYGGTSDEAFYGVAIDSNDNIICVGYTASEGVGSTTYWNALVVKFDSNLTILARKIYGGTSSDSFYGVAIDSSNNIICAGFTHSEGTGAPTYWNALVVKFDSTLTILARKTYSGANHDIFRAVVIDSNNNVICAGYTYSEGTGSPTYQNALVVKFDSTLTILARKVYGGANNDVFYGVAIDSDNNVICAGATASEGLGSNEALVLKLPMDIPSGTFVGTTLTGLTLSDSNLTLAESALTLADSTLTLANSGLTLTDSTLTLADSTLILEKDEILL